MNRSSLTRKKVLVPAVAVLVLAGGGVAWAATASADDVSGSELERVERAAVDAAGGGTVTDVEKSDDRGVAYEVELRMPDGVEVDLELDDDLAVVSRQSDGPDDDSGDDDSDRSRLDETARQKAEAAALDEVGEDAVVTDVESTDDRDAAYEVDVVQRDGSSTELRLDESFAVVSRQDEPRRDERGLSETQVQRAERAALAEVDGGIVTDVETSDDRGVAYEVEVVAPDGRDLGVELDRDFAVVSIDR